MDEEEGGDIRVGGLILMHKCTAVVALMVSHPISP